MKEIIIRVDDELYERATKVQNPHVKNCMNADVFIDTNVFLYAISDLTLSDS